MPKAASKDYFPNEVHSVKSEDLKEIRNGPKGGKGTAERAKKEFLKLLEDGYKVKEAMSLVGRTEKTYENWRKGDPEFAKSASRIIGKRYRKAEQEKKEVPDFPEFCDTYLGRNLFRHQLQWYDVLEGRQPRELHEAQIYEPGRSTHLVINTPPEHAKTTTITVMYVVWRILKDPNTRVILISKKQGMAADFLYEIKDILTNPEFAELQDTFGPPEGFEKACPIWTANRFYFGSSLRDVSMKDPTVQAIGMGGQLYGARADLIILDDCIEPDNAHEVDKQLNWLSRVVLTRPGKYGTVLVVGSRIASVDLYSVLRKPANDEVERAWTYFAQPAVEDFKDGKPENWLTLWPKSNHPQPGGDEVPDEDGLYPMWDGSALYAKRGLISQADETAWLQGYQQQEIAETAIFPREAVYGCVNKMRKIGLLNGGTPGHPPGGMTGMRVVAGLDPASSGFTAAVAVAFDPHDGKRYLLDAYNKQSSTPDQNRNLMLDWARRYSVSEWRVEKVLLSQYILQDRQLQRDLANLGCTLHEHITTSQSKWDADGGVLSLTGLFQGFESKDNLLEIPSTENENIRRLCEQLVVYEPKTRNATDLIMALWFAEARIRQLIQMRESNRVASSKWTTQRDKRRPMFRKKRIAHGV